MMNVIKTAIATIIISFISGLLLDYYKNFAPRLLCNIGNAIPMNLRGKKVFAYIITIHNISNKTIHEITLNIQNTQNNLKIAEAKITKGLKFDSSIKDKTLDVHIPFLSKGDKFSVTLYAEGQHAPGTKPVVIVRSPEKFKRIDSMRQNGFLSLLLHVPKNIVNAVSKPAGVKASRKPKNRKAFMIMASIALVVIIGFSGKAFLKAKSNNPKTNDVDTTVHKQPADNSSRGSAKTTDTTGSSSKNTIKSTNTTNSSYKNTGNGNTNSGSSASGNSTGNKSSNSQSSESTKDNKSNTENTNTKADPSSGNNSKDTNSDNSSSGDTTGNNNSANPSSDSTGGNAAESN